MKSLYRIFAPLTPLLFVTLFGCGLEIHTLRTSFPSSLTESDGLPLGDHRMFITSTAYTGRLGDGLADADAFCGTVAASAGLTRTYRAILSDSVETARDRIASSGGGGVYMLDDLGVKKIIFNSVSTMWVTDPSAFPQVWDAPTLNPPIYSELMTDMGGNSVTTGTYVDGTLATADCSAIGDPPAYGFGTPTDTYTQLLPGPPWSEVHTGESTWVYDFDHAAMPAPAGASCYVDFPIYCISQ